ncbi:MAG: ERAP1-like C-terminal domain-containing protein, partial [Mycobacterium sp.]
SPAREEGETTGTLRATLLEALGTTGADPDVRSRAARLHGDFLAGKATPDPDLAGAVVTVVAKGGGREQYEAFLERFRHPSTPQEELRYLYGLAGFQQLELVERTLELSMTEVRSQNAAFVIAMLLANRAGGPTAWEFVKSRWTELLARLPDPVIPRMLEGTVTLCSDDKLVADIHSFCSSHPVRSGRRTVEQILERLDVNRALAEREGPQLGRLLSARR